MIEIDWEQDRPDDDEVIAWVQAQTNLFTPVDMSSAALDELLKGLNAAFTSKYHPDGGARFAAFNFAYDPRLHWFVSRHSAEEIGFIEALLHSSVFQTALPEITPEEMEIKWERGSTYTFDGVLAGLIVSGGAYYQYTGTGRQAKDLGMRVCDSLFGDRFEEVDIYLTLQHWSSWFKGIPHWNYTYVGIDRREQRVWVLCITDTD